jgi:hypothetical protein
MFAGGNQAQPGEEVPSNVVDLFTDPSLAGNIAKKPRGSYISVTLSNPGTSALLGPDTVAIYASTHRTLDGSAVLLGIERVRRTLVAGNSEQVSVPFSLPADLPAGQYHLITAAGPRGQLVQFASTRRTFTIGSTGSIARPSAMNAASVFSSDWPITRLAATQAGGELAPSVDDTVCDSDCGQGFLTADGPTGELTQ